MEALFLLPHRFVIPNTLFEDELLRLGSEEKAILIEQGLEVINLSGDLVQRATRYFNQYVKKLTANDCFALVLAENTENSILMTGDGQLRGLAEQSNIETHGVLWAIDGLDAHGVVAPHVLCDALRLFQNDELVFLPPEEITRRLRRLEQRR